MSHKEGRILYEVLLDEQSLGITLASDSDERGAIVSGFFQLNEHILCAERLRKIALTDRIISIQGKNVENEDFDTIMDILRKKKRPVKIVFERGPIPSDLVISWNEVKSNLNSLFIYLRFLKRKRLYLCYIWLSFVIEVERLGLVDQDTRQRDMNSILNTYIKKDGMYSACLFYTFPVPYTQWKTVEQVLYYFHNMKAELLNRVMTLSWAGFSNSPEYRVLFPFSSKDISFCV